MSKAPNPSIKNRIYVILEVENKKGSTGWWFDVVLISIISLNVFFLIIESVESIYQQYKTFFNGFELFSVLFFTIEYFLRIWTSNENPRYAHPVKGRLRYMIRPIAVIDLLAFLPFYLPFFTGELRFLRMLRVFRILRLFKMARYFRALVVIKNVIKRKKYELSMSMAVLVFILIFASCIMFYVEKGKQPDAFTSIPDTMWWGIATLTTVGYGDIYPVTPLGRILGGFISVLGIGFFALPAGILSSGFSEELSNKRNKRR